jgi:xanthine/CO dehydrogenase XdhC/CoxF family maturation factor
MNTPQEFAPLLAGLRRLEAGNFSCGAALATLTRTRGSTFRRAGARMLVCGDGTVVRGLSGGCPEADIINRGHDVIAAGRAQLVRYDREHGLDALMELGCGGELEVLIEPLRGAADVAFVSAVAACLEARGSGVLATVFAQDGHCIAPRPRRLVWTDRVAYDDLDDAVLSQAVVDCARRHAAGRPTVESIAAPHGIFEVLLERLQPPYAAVLVGVNAGSLALARIAAQLGWITTLVDHRDDRPPPADLPSGVTLVQAAPRQLRQKLQFDARSFAVVMTHNLERDIDYLQALRDAPLAYLGAIGSRQRCAQLFDATGLDTQRLHAPAGLDIGSETPEEIALSIASEILAVSSGRSATALSTSNGPIH